VRPCAVSAQLGNHRETLAYCQQALPLHERYGNGYGEAGTWDSLGHADADQVRARLQELAGR
jgi:hypothetical protein